MKSNKVRHISILILCIIILTGVFSCKDKSDHRFTNALADETSPYLLQHAHNPVNWQPWSDDLWEQATQANKLVVISIGYASCHWCHVMEEETFEDEAVASVMNEKYISVKVDREERPDVDQVYMTALQLLTGNGGWPLNIIATPEGKPLYGGTYHSKDEWMQVLTELDSLYHADPAKASEFANRVAQGVQAVNQLVAPSAPQKFKKSALATSIKKWQPLWDTINGGMAGDQKFMTPTNLQFLLKYTTLEEDEEAQGFLTTTLNSMANGGVYDHVGGGFFRYATDSQWRIPHFEKMLYDNAQALELYALAFKQSKTPVYRAVIEETIAFLDRDLSNGQGAYFAAIDADSEGEEGLYYLWQEQELRKLLGEDFSDFAAFYGVQPGKTWEHNAYVLHRESSNDPLPKMETIGRWKDTLLSARNSRVKPLVDDKIITSWNALLISGMVNAAQALEKPEYLEKAIGIFNFLKKNSISDQGLRHTYKPGAKFVPGFLEDYSFLASASIDLYLMSMDEQYLDFALELQKEAQKRFKETEAGLYHFTQNQDLISTIVKTDDGVLPSPNAIMALNYFRLGHIFYDKEYLKKANAMLSTMHERVLETPYNYGTWSQLYLNQAYPYFEIAVVGSGASEMLNLLQQQGVPNALILGTESPSDQPLFKNRFVSGETLIYVCRNATCKMPVTTIDAALKQVADW